MDFFDQYDMDEQEFVDTELLETDSYHELIVYNDDFNTFDWVIESFVTVCKHSYTQAEQLSLIVHFKGKAVVKTGPFDELKPMKDALIERGLSAAIESLCDK